MAAESTRADHASICALLGRAAGSDRFGELAQVQIGVRGAEVRLGIVIVDRRGAPKVCERIVELPVAERVVTGGDRFARRRKRDAVTCVREVHAAGRNGDLRDLERLAIDDGDRAAQRLAGADDHGLSATASGLADAAEPLERGRHLLEAVGGGRRGGPIALEAQHRVPGGETNNQAFIIAAGLRARDPLTLSGAVTE